MRFSGILRKPFEPRLEIRLVEIQLRDDDIYPPSRTALRNINVLDIIVIVVVALRRH